MGFHTYVMDMATKEVSKGSSSRPNITFIVGTVVVTLAFLSVTFLFLCCYHWAMIFKDVAAHDDATSSGDDDGKAAVIIRIEQLPPCEVPVVFMPGHELPTFIAVPCPYPPPLPPPPLVKTHQPIEGDNDGSHITPNAS